VLSRWKPFVNCWKPLLTIHLALLMAAAGCSKGGGDASQSPPAALGVAAGKTPLPGGKGNMSDDKHPVVVIDTSLGKITVELDAEKAQVTVANFLQYVEAKHYDQTIVHQIYKGQGILAGGYGTDLVERRGRTAIFNEARKGLPNLRGTISMVRSPDAQNSATCQFFINLVDNPSLDHKDETPEGYGYCVFGKVVEGMTNVVDVIGNVPVHDTPALDRTPVETVKVASIRRLR
jgi:peptidyl-prolyl cis-trans isomerase B (cyclophilin B)